MTFADATNYYFDAMKTPGYLRTAMKKDWKAKKLSALQIVQHADKFLAEDKAARAAKRLAAKEKKAKAVAAAEKAAKKAAKLAAAPVVAAPAIEPATA